MCAGTTACGSPSPPAGSPPAVWLYQEAATQAVNGIPVTTASFRGQSDGRTLTTCAADSCGGDASLDTLPRCRTVHLADRGAGVVRHRRRQRLHHRASERQNSSHNRARASGGRGGRRRGGGSRSHPLPHTLAGLSPGVNSKCLSLFPIFFDFTGRDAVIFSLDAGRRARL